VFARYIDLRAIFYDSRTRFFRHESRIVVLLFITPGYIVAYPPYSFCKWGALDCRMVGI
jgi:hypothetical protein